MMAPHEATTLNNTDLEMDGTDREVEDTCAASDVVVLVEPSLTVEVRVALSTVDEVVWTARMVVLAATKFVPLGKVELSTTVRGKVTASVEAVIGPPVVEIRVAAGSTAFAS
jgi:hypothetical protein